MCIFNDFDNKDNKFRLNRIVFPLRDKRYLTFFSHFHSVLYYFPQDTGATQLLTPSFLHRFHLRH